MNRLLVSLACAGAILPAAFAPALAGELPDPTRPPAALRAASPGGAATAMPAPAPLVLQSVLTGEGRTPTAIINGRVVELGDAVDGLRLVRVFDTGASLAGPKGTTTLALTPGSEKVAAAAPAPAPLLASTRAPRRLETTAASLRTGEQK